MPELPEVQTVVSDLKDILAGQTLESIVVNDEKVWFESELKPDKIVNEPLVNVTRRGKYIVYNFAEFHLLQHLRMTGKVLPIDSPEIPHNKLMENSKQIRAFLNFNKTKLAFYDQRRFGTITAILDLDTYFKTKKIAPEIYGESSADALSHYLDKVKRIGRPIKSTILDQSVISGPGNIYADEALHRVGLHPETVTSQIDIAKHKKLFEALKQVMQEAISKRGTSASDYLDVNGNPGVFFQYLNVYKREGQDCKTCTQNPIKRIKISGRSSHFCPNCQPLTK